MANPALMKRTAMPMDNPWPKKTRMERLIEKFVCNNTRCYTCGGLVYAVETKKTTNHIYHNRCFRCRVCKRNLTESSLNEEGDDIYCTNCYRKKQKGDCGGLDFKRAAEERAQFVYNRRHPDQPPSKPNPRPPIQHDLSRQTSWALRQLERRFLSHQEPITKESNENYRRIVSDYQPSTIKTKSSAPNDLPNLRGYLSSIENEPSPAMKFSPLSSPSTSIRSGSTSRGPTTPRTPTTPLHFNLVKTQDQKLKLFNPFQPRLNQSSINLSNPRTPTFERTANLVNNENTAKRQNQTSFYFPDTHISPNHRRSHSVNYSVSPRKIQ